MYFVFIHENRRMKSVEIVLSEVGERPRTMEGVGRNNSNIYCEHICKYHNAAPCTSIIG
jgi:hypothetical protein